MNEMRMHYTWIAGDINFLPWTCSGPRARAGQQGGRAVPCRAERLAGKEGADGRAREGGWSSTRYITSTRCVTRDARDARDERLERAHTCTHVHKNTRARAHPYAHHWSSGGGGKVGRKEGRREVGDSTGCFVLTRPTTCELLPGFLRTFASPVILTSGTARRIPAPRERGRGKNEREEKKSKESRATKSSRSANDDETSRSREAPRVRPTSKGCGERANRVGNHWTFRWRCLIFGK